LLHAIRRYEEHGTREAAQEAADALGVALSTLKSMKSGETKISNAVAIACRAMEAEPAMLAAHFEPRSAGRPRKRHAAGR